MDLAEKQRFQISLKERHKVLSLCWREDELLDLASGGVRYRLDGSIEAARVNYAYHFDRALITADGLYSAIYESLGTKGLILRGGKIVREINRSYYFAHAYEFPVAIFKSPDNGEWVLAHCPNAYNKIEIEEIESGRSLTMREGEPADFFHSRFQSSAGGEYLLSAGWVWHPLDTVELFSIREALRNPVVLDKYSELQMPDELFEVHAATFHDGRSIIMVGDNGHEPAEGGHGQFLVRYDCREGRVLSKAAVQETVGTIMAAGNEHVVGFYEHPKLINISTGEVVRSWPELNSGKQNSSIIWHAGQVPPIAMDSKRMRFAIADPTGITVIQLG